MSSSSFSSGLRYFATRPTVVLPIAILVMSLVSVWVLGNMLAHGKQLPPASLDRVVTARTLLVWLVMISGAITAVALSWHLFQYRRPKPEWACSRCGYDLTGNESGICSECGWVITRQQSE